MTVHIEGSEERNRFHFMRLGNYTGITVFPWMNCWEVVQLIPLLLDKYAGPGELLFSGLVKKLANEADSVLCIGRLF